MFELSLKNLPARLDPREIWLRRRSSRGLGLLYKVKPDLKQAADFADKEL